MTDDAKNTQPVAATKGGSLADSLTVSEAPGLLKSFPPATLLRAGVLLAIVAAMNHRQFGSMLFDWRNNPNWSHGFIIPLFSLWLLYSRRDELLSAPRRTCLWGLAILLPACAMQVAAYVNRNPWTCQLSMLLVLLGLVLLLAGPKVTRVAWLPILFLAFAMPISGSIYGQIALPLQNIAAKGAYFVLTIFGAKVKVSASHLTVWNTVAEKWEVLTVAEACSGMRLLMAFVALSVAMAYLEDRALWQRLILVALGIPVAILCNVIRVAITCSAFVLGRPEWGKDFMHEFTGMLMLIPAFGLLWLAGKLLNAVFAADEDDEEPDEAGDGAAEVRT